VWQWVLTRPGSSTPVSSRTAPGGGGAPASGPPR
jgi:hypothetical protein